MTRGFQKDCADWNIWPGHENHRNKKEHQHDFDKLMKKIEQSMANPDQKYYLIGINLDADPRHHAESRNYLFEKIKVIKVVSASSIKKVKFFNN